MFIFHTFMKLNEFLLYMTNFICNIERVNKMIVQIKYLALLVIFLLLACTRNNSPLETNEFIDPLLIGNWIKISEKNISGRPNTSISGIKIYEDGYITTLGIEISNGKLAELSKKNDFCRKIIKASKGEMIVKVPQQGFSPGHTYTREYEISDSTLTYISIDANGNYFSDVNYKRSGLSDKIVNPVISNFSTINNSDTLKNFQIWHYPSAYFGYGHSFENGDMVFEIYSRNSNNTSINIQLSEFNGVGEYILGTSNDGMAYFSILSGCAIPVYHTEQPNSGFIRIDKYNLLENICSGSFEFYVYDKEYEFKEGRFRLPVYH